AIFCELKHLAMPSRKQIREFLESGVVAEYDDKHPQAIFSALTRQSTLSWTQVAERFGRD
ncbi:MAG: hypothetical protein NTW02_04290, partial [Cyanobium sp. LacPavin_0920_WC12_MAG_62_9]|nr:hypothetical protein [Cyanobium sp. LacPavin_0920_WC12_MAG_62_9]